MTCKAGLQKSVDAVFVDLWGGLDVRVAVRKVKTWVPAASQTLKRCVKRDWFLSDLLSSNLLPLCLKRLRIHIASDKLDRDRAPPAAKPEAVAEMLGFGAVESQVFKNLHIEKKKSYWILNRYCLFYLDKWVSLPSSYHDDHRSAARVRVLHNLYCMKRSILSCILVHCLSSWLGHFRGLRAWGISTLWVEG